MSKPKNENRQAPQPPAQELTQPLDFPVLQPSSPEYDLYLSLLYQIIQPSD